MSNLLSKLELLTAPGEAQVYVVHGNKDWRMSLATLISLVTKASLDLSNVDNTRDLEKPISLAVQDALNQKANKTEVPTKAELDSLAQSLQSYVTTQALAEAIIGVQQAMASFQTKPQVDEAVNTAVTPVVQSLQSFNLSLIDQLSRINALETAELDNVSAANLSEAIFAALQSADTAAAARDLLVTNAFSAETDAITQSLQDISGTLNLLKSQFENHTHTTDQITGLNELIANIMEQASSVKVGPNEW